MASSLRWIFLALAAALLTGCFSVNAKGPVYSAKTIEAVPDRATLVFYRPNVFVGSALWPTVRVDGVPALKLYNGGYSTLTVAPGRYRLSARIEEKTDRFTQREAKQDYAFELDARADAVYYIEYAVVAGGQTGTINVQGQEMPYSRFPLGNIRWHASEKFPSLLRGCRYVAPLVPSLPVARKSSSGKD